MSSRSPTRRGFLGLAMVLAAGWVAARLWPWRRIRREPGGARAPERAASATPAVAAIAQLLAHRFDYLAFESGASERFAEDWIDAFGPLAGDAPDEDFYDTFLLSTDFFQHGGDETRVLRYVTLFSPYVSPCYNPLVRRDLPSA